MIDFKKVSYHEKDDSNFPKQYFFRYESDRDDIENIVDFYGGGYELDQDIEIDVPKFCLTEFTPNEYKLELVLTSSIIGRYWQKWIGIFNIMPRNIVAKFMDKVY